MISFTIRKEVFFMSKYIFRSVLSKYFISFMNAKEALGIRTDKYLSLFKEFDTFCVNEKLEAPIITKSLILKWKSCRVNDSTATIYDKYSILSQLAKYMCHIGISCYIPHMPRSPLKRYTAYIFTHEQMKEIFDVSDNLQVYNYCLNSKLIAIPAILRLIYSIGLRISEATGLQNSDIDMTKSTILIRKSKNLHQRIIPMNDSIKQLLLQYIEARNKLPLKSIENPESSFFIAADGMKINSGTVYSWFKKILAICGIPHIGRGQGPRVHDLRHTFAVHSLMAQVRAGADIYCILPILSVFLGHQSIEATERYVRLTQEMFPEVISQQQAISSFVFPLMSKTIVQNEKE